MKEHGETEVDMMQMKDKLKSFIRSCCGSYEKQTNDKIILYVSQREDKND
jgi:hypothetical protein